MHYMQEYFFIDLCGNKLFILPIKSSGVVLKKVLGTRQFQEKRREGVIQLYKIQIIMKQKKYLVAHLFIEI